MKRTSAVACSRLALAAALTIAITLAANTAIAEAPKATEKIDMAEMMARAKKLTQPSEHHQLLKRFLGTWDTQLEFTMAGMDGPPEKGTATFSWLMEGRWLEMKSSGTFLGSPNQSYMIFGYDNFKQSYVTVSVGNVDTAMLTSEGDLDPRGDVLITYGTLDEYLTGEHDKMVKYVWRFHGDDKIVLEVHDLPIGEHNAQVMELTFNRKRG
ncbi:MAG: DUF1579 family protein [Acidobacteriota bacterium]